MKILELIEKKKHECIQPIQDMLMKPKYKEWDLMLENVVYYKLNIKLRQIQSIKTLGTFLDQHPDLKAERFIELDASVNRISFISGLDRFNNLKEIDLSLNQIKSLKGLTCLSELRHLSISNNYITELKPLIKLPLIKLDLSMNSITSVIDLGKISTLQQLWIQGNSSLTSLNGLQKLPNLMLLHAQNNSLTNIDPLSSCTSLTDLSIAGNQVEDIDNLARVIICLTNLKTLNCCENPVEKSKDYRFRMLQNPSIQKLDHTEIRSHLRRRLAELSKTNELKGLVESTTEEYMTRIEKEKEVLDQGLQFYRSRQEMILNAFTEYKSQLEGELEDCVTYAQALHGMNRDSYLLTSKGLETWKQKISHAASERIEEEEKRKELEMKLKMQQAENDSKRLTYHQKLRELSLKKPQVWQEIKRHELEMREREEIQLDHDVHERQILLKNMKNQLNQQRNARRQVALKLAHDFSLEKTAEWTGSIKAIETKVKNDIIQALTMTKSNLSKPKSASHIRDENEEKEKEEKDEDENDSSSSIEDYMDSENIIDDDEEEEEEMEDESNLLQVAKKESELKKKKEKIVPVRKSSKWKIFGAKKNASLIQSSLTTSTCQDDTMSHQTMTTLCPPQTSSKYATLIQGNNTKHGKVEDGKGHHKNDEDKHFKNKGKQLQNEVSQEKQYVPTKPNQLPMKIRKWSRGGKSPSKLNLSLDKPHGVPTVEDEAKPIEVDCNNFKQ